MTEKKLAVILTKEQYQTIDSTLTNLKNQNLKDRKTWIKIDSIQGTIRQNVFNLELNENESTSN